MRVANQKIVTIDYTLTDPQGAVLDTSKGRQPLAYLHGVGGIIPGLEAALHGKAAGESLKVTIPPEQAYGFRDPSLIQVVPRDRFPAEAEISVGTRFQAQTGQGERAVIVVGVTPGTVRVDANHPLSDMTLHFDVTIVSIRDATQVEIDHGHAHMPGGHEH